MKLTQPEAHIHEACRGRKPDHWCKCSVPTAWECMKCSRNRFNATMARKFAEDNLSTEQILGARR
jgi:hypothetical protein